MVKGKIFGVLILFFCCCIKNFAQTETVQAEHEIYEFLKEMSVKGILAEYDEIILPLSYSEINRYLIQVEANMGLLSSAETDFLIKMRHRLNNTENRYSILDEKYKFNTQSSRQDFYSYHDSSISFYINPVISGKGIYDTRSQKGAGLFKIGAKAAGSYNDWLGYSVSAMNGIVKGDNLTAALNRQVNQSFTFNNTKINYFDETRGYLRAGTDNVSLQLGRDRILWGRENVNRLILSDNPQLFDFLKFRFKYKSISYNFIHSWLVQPAMNVTPDSLNYPVKYRNSKYAAMSRIGYSCGNLGLGLSQIVIYSNRPLEGAYLTPLLFWESAQRSLEDLDNSFLVLDGKYRLINGLEINSTLLMDDIKFEFFGGDWNNVQNRMAFQAGFNMTSPLIPSNLSINFEYLYIRPYTFSHEGGGESLTYTNNGFLLGTEILPNSIVFSGELKYRISGDLIISVTGRYGRHGGNIYDSEGKLIKNFGGSIFEPPLLEDDREISILSGEKSSGSNLKIAFDYEIYYGAYLQAVYYNSSNFPVLYAPDAKYLTAGIVINFE